MATDTGTPKKMRKLDGSEGDDSADFGQDFDAETQKILEAIDHCQNDIDNLNEQASEEILKVEQKYNKLRKPFFEQRNNYIKEIKEFWYTAFMNHPQISAILDEEEEELLKSLYQVEVEEFEDIKSGYRIKFHFSPNDYFDNDMLCKEFQLGTTGDPTSQSMKINWKANKDLTKKVQDAHIGQKRKSASRSFFTWYSDNTDPSADDIAEVIKDDMWPNPIQYFQNHGIEIGENGMDSDEEDDDLDESVVVVGDDDDEEEEDEDEEEEDDVVVEGEEEEEEEDEGEEDKDAA